MGYSISYFGEKDNDINGTINLSVVDALKGNKYMDFAAALIMNTLFALYRFVPASLLFAVVFMFAYREIRKRGVKRTAKSWIEDFKTNKEFRRVLALAFYVMMVLFRTVLCRGISTNTLRYFFGVWGLHYPNGKLYIDGVANIILFVPMTALMLWALKDRIFRNRKFGFWSVLTASMAVAFVFSLSIETMQFFMKIGAVQLSDLVYNTIGGGIGGIIYYILYRIKHKEKNDEL